VLAVIDLLNRQNPDLCISRQAVVGMLSIARDVAAGTLLLPLDYFYSAGLVKWEWIQPELMQIGTLYGSSSQFAFFDVLGRSQHSIQTTRLTMVLLRKLFTDKDCLYTDDEQKKRLEIAACAGGDTEAAVRYLDALISALDTCDSGVGRVRNIVQKGFSFIWRRS
jgi:hypothetical protein